MASRNDVRLMLRAIPNIRSESASPSFSSPRTIIEPISSVTGERRRRLASTLRIADCTTFDLPVLVCRMIAFVPCSFLPPIGRFPLPAKSKSLTRRDGGRSEEHTSELQSLMRNSYDVFCLKKNNNHTQEHKPGYKEHTTKTIKKQSK